MKEKLRSAAVVLAQAVTIWMVGWLCCVGIGRLMVLFHLGG